MEDGKLELGGLLGTRTCTSELLVSLSSSSSIIILHVYYFFVGFKTHMDHNHVHVYDIS